MLQYPAVQLFTERAQMVKPGFRLTGWEDAEAVARICQRLDGIPLAIELAAARAGLLTLPQIAARLGERFRLLTGGRGGMTRHQTLHALIDWSYDLLTAPEQALLRRLSICVDGWTLDAAEALWAGVRAFGDAGVQVPQSQDQAVSVDPEHPNGEGPNALDHRFAGYPPKGGWMPPERLNADPFELLASLTDKSLVLADEAPLSPRVRGGGEGLRYRMLETVREYSLQKLQAGGEEATVRSAHAAYFLALAEAAAEAMHGPEQGRWLNLLEAEHGNLRAALAWSLEAPGDGELGLRLATAVEVLWSSRHYLDEGRRYLDAVLSSPQAAGRTAARAAALHAAGDLAFLQSDFAAARARAEESLAIGEALEDPLRIARALYLLSALTSSMEEARELATQSLALFRECHYPPGIATTLTRLSSFASAAQDQDTARTLHREALTVVRSIGDRSLEAGCLSGLASIEYDRRDYAAARACFQDSLALARELGLHNQTAVSLYFLGLLALQASDYPAARACWEECREINRRNQTKGGSVLGALAELAALQGDFAMARARWEESLAEGRELGRHDLVARALRGLADVARLEGNFAAALAWYAESLQVAQVERGGLDTKIADERPDAECAACLRGIAAILSGSGRAEQAVRLLGAAEALAEAVGASMPPAGRTAYEEEVAGLRESVGAAAFAAAWAEGRADAQLVEQLLDQAVEYAAEGEEAAPVETVSPRPLAPSPASPDVQDHRTAAAPGLSPAAPSRLPRPMTTLIGRSQELEEATALLGSSRLVTLSGGGGVGKTRLALQVATGLEGRYPGRVAFVELAALADPALLPAFAAAALGLHEEGEAPSQDRMQALTGWLAPEPALLVLDNCEHLIEAAATLCQTLLERCPRLHILATSRQRLGLTGEVVWRVPSLPSPTRSSSRRRRRARWSTCLGSRRPSS